MDALFYNVLRLIVGSLTALQFGTFSTSLVIAALFLLFGLFIDALPAIIILGTVLLPVALAADIHPLVFAIIGIISLVFGLVTPPYGLCLLISSSIIAGLNVVQVLRDVVIVLIPMLFILLLIIAAPEIALWLPKNLMPAKFK